jgi:outer membrane receptor for ferrienterochelin and colicin
MNCSAWELLLNNPAMKKLFTRIASITLGLTALADYAHAQNTQDFQTLSLEDLLNVKITTVSKSSQSVGEAPATVIVISAKQIKTRGYTNLTEVLNDLPDIKVNDKSDLETSASFIIRGIRRQDRFVILMDGIRISSPTNEALPLLENFPIYLAKQIEVVYGPGSALYGADAMSGVINIITAKGEGPDQYEARTMAGTQGYSNQHLFLRKTLKNGLNLTAGGQYLYDRQPDFSKIYPKEYSMLAQQTGLFNSSYGPMQADQPTDKAYSAPFKAYNMYLSLDKGPFDFKLLRHYAQVPTSATLKPDNGVYNKNVFYGSGVTTANIAYTDSIGNLRSVTSLQGSYYELNPKSNYRNLYGGMEHGYKYAFGSMIKLDEQISFPLARIINVMGGLTYELFNSIPKSVELAAPIAGNGAVEGILLNSSDIYNPRGIQAKFYHLKYHNVGSFLQGQFTAFKKFAMTLGMRYDNNSRFGSTINPRVGLIYNHTSKTTIKALYGTAYWAPSPHTSFEQYGSFYSSDSGRSYRSSFWHLPNPGLKPTTSQTAEISINHKINRYLNLTLTGYYTHMRNLITNVPDNGNTNLYNNRYLGYAVDYIEVPFNAGTQKNYGGNLIVNSAFNIGASKFKAWTSISYVDGTVMENGPSSKSIEVHMPYVAPWQFRAGIDGHSDNFNYSVRLLHSGKQRVTGVTDEANPHDRQLLSGFTLVNASAGYTWKERLTFFAKVQNALNQRYRNPIDVDLNDNNSITFHGSVQDPLRVMAGLTFSLR